MRLLRQAALAAGLVLAPAVAEAQCRLCAQPVGQPATAGPPAGSDIELQIETNLNFDRLILGGSGSGAVTMRPDGSTGVEGSVVATGPRAMVGTVLVHGDPNRTLRVDMPRRVDLFSDGGGRATVDDITSDLPKIPRLDAVGNLTFRFGGRLVLSGNTDGPLRGDIPITVEYQ